MNLRVNEIFYSLQGEGRRQGEASIFIRLSGCNLKCSFCDTQHSSGREMSLKQILATIRPFPCRWIVWTGGEPTLQLTERILLFFNQQGYRQAIESNGLLRLPPGLDYTVVSPKGPETDYARKINPRVDELRLPIEVNQPIPSIASLPTAAIYFLSPLFSPNAAATAANIRYCVDCIKANPRWRLSLQVHKLIGIE
jgi:organic radical activating enzyme